MGLKIEKQQTKVQSSFDLQELLNKEIHFSGNGFSNKTKEHFYSEIATLLEADLNLLDTLKITREQFKQKKEIQILDNFIRSLIAGKAFSQAMEKNTKSFSNYEIMSVRIGEETGRLPIVFNKLSDFYSKKNQQKKQILSALSYPLVVLCTAMAAVFFMLNFVVPMFEDIFKQNKVELPVLTQYIINTSHFFRQHILKITFLFLGLFVLFFIFKKEKKVQIFVDQFLLRIPFVGSLVLKNQLLLFTQAFSLLLTAKITLLEGIQLLKKMIHFHPLNTALAAIETKLLNGQTFSEALEDESIFDSKMKSLIKVADETNNTLYAIDKLSEQYASELDQSSKNLNSIAEPLIIIVLGGIVAVILVAMYLPMFKLSSVLG